VALIVRSSVIGVSLANLTTDIEYVAGDATNPLGEGTRVVCHICNDNGGWGRGFVLAISKRWKEPEEQYRDWHRSGEAGGFALGAVQLVEVEPSLSVANMIAQHGTRSSNGVPPIRYDALRECLAKLATLASQSTASVHMPRIGCGLAGGTWPEVEAIINATLVRAGIRVVVYDLAPA
jgi:O-acetyl-ADP-ribose deacetylase (regulator of RNase III)